MATGFGMCLYKFREYPEQCEFRVKPTLECSASQTELLVCFLKRYGAKLSPDAGVRLIECLCHLILESNNPEEWEQMDSPVAVDDK